MSANEDSLTRFILQRANVRGALVSLNESWRAIAERSSYPSAVAHYLAQCTAAAALFTASIKINGRLSIQMRGEGTIRTLFSECSTEGTVRGIAHFEQPVPDQLALSDFGRNAVLAITIENNLPEGREPQRYQGLVGMQAETLSAAFEQYFVQSEQLPTRIVLFGNAEQAAGLLIQQLPEQTHEQDDWQRAQALFDTVTEAELFELDAEDILYRLFHEENVRVLEHKSIEFACSCSRARVENVLLSLGQEEIAQTLQEQGEISVNCDFCGQGYHFSAEQGLSLFWPKPSAPGSVRLQ